MSNRLGDAGGLRWIVASATVSGLSTYVLLVLAAQGLGAERFDTFSGYWAALIAVSVGAFLPVEQIVARRSASGFPVALIARWMLPWGAVTVALSCLAYVGLSRADSQADVSAVLVCVFALNVGAVGVQAVLRGLAAGRHRLDVYAVVIIVDAVLRTALTGVLASGGPTAVVNVALAIAVGCCAGVLVGGVLLLRTREVPTLGRTATTVSLSREGLMLVPATLSMQVLVNSPIYVATLSRSPGLSAGLVLAISSLVRSSVFVAQAAQAAYVARIATLVHQGSPLVRRTSMAVLGAAVLVAIGTVVGTVAAGPWLVEVLYGDDFAVTRRVCLLVSAGIAVFLVAIVANDLAVARGMHRRAGHYWVIALLVATASAALMPEGNARTFGPIIVGSSLALLLTLLASRSIDLNPLGRVVGGGDEDQYDREATAETH